MRTITHGRRGSVCLTLDLGLGAVELHAEDRADTVLTLAPLAEGDQLAMDLIARAADHDDERELVVTVPRPAGGARTITISGRSNMIVVNGCVVGASWPAAVGNGGVRVVARVPAGSAVAVTTDAADLTTAGRLDTVTYESASGSARVADAHAVRGRTASGDIVVGRAVEVSAWTASGDVRCGSVARVDAQTASGDIWLRRLAGVAEANTASGDVTVHAVADGEITARSASGDVEVTTAAGVRVRTRLSSVTGWVHAVRVSA